MTTQTVQALHVQGLEKSYAGFVACRPGAAWMTPE
jgi:hypothetical protein